MIGYLFGESLGFPVEEPFGRKGAAVFKRQPAIGNWQLAPKGSPYPRTLEPMVQR